MADRLNYYFRQKVTEAELDMGFDGLEVADQNIMIDQGLKGAFSGLVVTQRGAGANLTVDISAGTAYDPAGQRIRVPTTQNLNVAVDTLGVTTTVAGGGKSKVVSIFVKAKRALSDPRTDGNSATVYFQSDETFDFYVKQGAEATSGSEVPPALEADMILIADIRRTNGVPTILNAEIQPYASNRRQDTFVNAGATYNLRAGTIKDAVESILAIANDVADNLDDLTTGLAATTLVTDAITRERTAPLTVTGDVTLTAAQQNAVLTSSAKVTMPDPASCAGRTFYIRLSGASLGRVLSHASETINGSANGFPMNQPKATYAVRTSDGVNWEACICPATVDSTTLEIFDDGGYDGSTPGTYQVFGRGFRLIDQITENSFDINGVGGSYVIHDDGWMTVVSGGTGSVAYNQLVIRPTDDPDYDGTTYRML